MKTDYLKQNNQVKGNYTELLIFVIFIILIVLLGNFNKIIFHSVSEIVGIIIGINLFILTWNTRSYLKNDFILSLGIGYLFISVLDLFHTLSFPGFMINKSFVSANTSVTFWVIARYFEALLWLTSPIWFSSKLNKNIYFTISFIVTIILIALNLNSKILPLMIDSNFKISNVRLVGDMVINSILLISFVNFIRFKKYFQNDIFRSLASALLIFIIIGFVFNVYSQQGVENMLGWHIGKIIACLILYKTILVNGLQKPFSILFRELQISKNNLLEHQQKLEKLIEEKTSDLVSANIKLNKISKSIPVAIFEIIREDSLFKFTYFSKGTLFQKAFPIGSEIDVFLEKIHEKYRHSFISFFNKGIKGEVLFDFIYNIDFDEIIWLRMILTQSSDNFFGVLHDITQEIENKSLENQLIVSQKVETIGSITNTVVHDFNNILHGISSSVELIPSNVKTIEYFERVHYLIDKGKNLISKLLKFSQQKEAKMEILTFDEFYDSICLFLNSFSSQTSRLEFYKDNKITNCALKLNLTELEQVFLNLTINATHASPQHGVIKISFKLFEKKLLIEIEDKGTGIPEEILKKIFEPYFTTKEEGRGTGLGLSVVKAIINKHEGDVSVSSVKEIGTIFKIFLPFINTCKQQVDKKSKEIFEIERKIFKKNSIYLVEDDEMLLDLITKQLESFGYDVLSFNNGYKLLEEVDRCKPDLIVSDYLMPKINGLELVSKLRSQKIIIPVLIISGFINDKDYSQIKTLKNTSILNKPFSKNELNENILKIINNLKEGSDGIY